MNPITFLNRGYRKGKYKPRGRRAVGIVIHTSGAGVWNRWNRENAGSPGPYRPVEDYDVARFTWSHWAAQRGFEPHPFDTAIRVYSSLMDAGPHAVICGETGRIAMGCPTELASWHVGSSGSWRYRYRGWKKKAQWWLDRWPELDSPRDLLGGELWSLGTANQLTLGLEVAPPDAGPYAPWTPAAWQSIHELAHMWAHMDRFVLDKYHVISHSDAHPLSRTAKGLPYDPGQRQWTGPDSALRAIVN